MTHIIACKTHLQHSALRRFCSLNQVPIRGTETCELLQRVKSHSCGPEKLTWTRFDRSVARETGHCQQLPGSCRRPGVRAPARPWRPASSVFEPGGRWGASRTQTAGTALSYVRSWEMTTDKEKEKKKREKSQTRYQNLLKYQAKIHSYF